MPNDLAVLTCDKRKGQCACVPQSVDNLGLSLIAVRHILERRVREHTNCNRVLRTFLLDLHIEEPLKETKIPAHGRATLRVPALPDAVMCLVISRRSAGSYNLYHADFLALARIQGNLLSCTGQIYAIPCISALRCDCLATSVLHA